MAAASLKARLSRPSLRMVRALALAVLVTQVLISVTGTIVRVTGSGLGCPTWPQCFPGSMVPVSHAEIAPLHQAIEFGNRLLTFVVGIAAIACFLAAWRSRPRRPRLVRLSLVMPLGVVAQAIIGGITVLVDLQWWSVSLHFLASAVLVWLAAILVKTASEGDDKPMLVITRTMQRLLVALSAVTFVMLFAGTLVTAAGPHAGDAATPRLDVPVETIARVHSMSTMAYVLLLAVFGVWLRSARPTKALLKAYSAACAVVLLQGAIGYTQYALGVPEPLVVAHVLGAMLVVVATSWLWCESRYRGPLPQQKQAEPVQQAAEPAAS